MFLIKNHIKPLEIRKKCNFVPLYFQILLKGLAGFGGLTEKD
jgi:hypothetical protein